MIFNFLNKLVCLDIIVDHLKFLVAVILTLYQPCSISFYRAKYDAEKAQDERARGLPNTQLDDQIPVINEDQEPANENDYGFIPPSGSRYVDQSLIIIMGYLWTVSEQRSK